VKVDNVQGGALHCGCRLNSVDATAQLQLISVHI